MFQRLVRRSLGDLKGKNVGNEAGVKNIAGVVPGAGGLSMPPSTNSKVCRLSDPSRDLSAAVWVMNI